MKVFFVVSVGRQVEGDMQTLKFEKCYTEKSKADNYAKELAKNYTETINTPDGPIPFVCYRAVHEIELEE